MSFPNFDPSQGQPNQFTGDNNGSAGPTSQQQPQSMQQQMPMMAPQQGMPQQQVGQNPEMPPSFQGQGGMDQGSVGGVPGGGDSKTTLWYVTLLAVIIQNVYKFQYIILCMSEEQRLQDILRYAECSKSSWRVL